MNFLILYGAILLAQSTYTLASNGDRSPFYQKCVLNCLTANCTDSSGKQFTIVGSQQQDRWSQLMFWNCKDECRYHCMWKTVDGFQQRGFEVPKFHGKWPFTRLLGVQEPAAAAASLLNLATHTHMYGKLKRRYSIYSSRAAMLWHGFYYVCVNAWFWSTVFHARDTPQSEFLDYACALSMVLALFVSAVLRVLLGRLKILAHAIVFVAVVYFANHVIYLYEGIVDYDFNIVVNTVFGVAGSLLWLGWAAGEVLAGRRHAWRMAAFVLLSGTALALELFDFPPRAGWDAHALWHLATAPLPLLFYRCVIDDLRYLESITCLNEKTDIKLA